MSLLHGDVIIDIRKIADEEYSETTAEMVNVAGTLTAISIQIKAQWEADHDIQRGGRHPKIYQQRFVFLPFLDHVLQEFDTRFEQSNKKDGHAQPEVPTQ